MRRHEKLRRVLDAAAAACGLLAVAPVLLVCAIAVLLDDGWPVLFRQKRVGRHGQMFSLIKFRSMRTGMSGASVTAKGDARCTATGRVMRRFKLDELPQLWNVLAGEMSLIGPRPEVPPYVDLQRAEWREVLAVRPGISDLATLVYRNEEELLAQAEDPERFYREVVLPDKLRLNIQYQRQRSLLRDAKLLALTVRYSFVPSGFDASRIEKAILA